MNLLKRREFLKISALSACTLVISTGLSGCDSDDNNIDSIDNNDSVDTNDSIIGDNVVSIDVGFNHGIASGDPLADKIIIWTRVATEAESVEVFYAVATDEAFTDVIHNGVVNADASTDYTVKIDIQNLESETQYYYRFSSHDITSETGKMKTLPVGSVERVQMAVFSCANYTNGYFNAYMEASKIENLDVSLHLGDYIYEYGTYYNDDFVAKVPSYATSNASNIGREFPEENNTECIVLDDYRKRYALYHTDAGLQALHKAAPMIVVWDDHEIANDTYDNGAENHDSSEGAFDTRVEAALQAYFEWLPIRPIENKKEIYRSFKFGDLVSLNMLETRILDRDEQLSYASYYDVEGNFDAVSFTTDLTASERTMMGLTQLEWLQGEMATSTTTWQVLGQQVLMGRMNLPAEILTPIGMLENPEAFGTTTEALMLQINTSLGELAQIKGRILQGDPSVTDEEKDRVNTTLPYNLDAWDGYFVERETILGTAKAFNKNLVVLAGDTHNSWANELKDINGEKVGVEFATSSVSSPGLEEYLSLPSIEEAMQLEGALQLLIDDLKYTNLYDRGFMEVVFTAEEAVSTWHYVSNYDSSIYTMNTQRIKSLKCLAGENAITAV